MKRPERPNRASRTQGHAVEPRLAVTAARAVLTATATTVGAASASATDRDQPDTPAGHVYVETNAAGGNQVLDRH